MRLWPSLPIGALPSIWLFLRRAAFSLGSGLGVLLVTMLALFTLAKVVDAVPFGTAFFWANTGLAVALVVILIGFWSAVRVAARHWGKRVASATVVGPLLGVIALGSVLTEPSPRLPAEFDPEALLDPVKRRPHDVMLIVDPNDPAVRSLVRLAQTKPGAVTPTKVEEWGIDVAFGLATLNPLGRGRPWSLRLAPTRDRRALVRALAAVHPSRSEPATASLGRAVRDIADPTRRLARWRSLSTQTIAFLTSELPKQAQLDTSNHPSAVRWRAALARIPRSSGYPRRTTLSALYERSSPEALTQWKVWTREVRGNVAHAIKKWSPFDDAAFLALNRFFFEDLDLGEEYRPYLKLHSTDQLHSTERFLPLDVEAYLARVKPQLCRSEKFVHDQCNPIKLTATTDLGHRNGYLKLEGDRRGGRDLARDDPSSPQRIYYRVSRGQGRVYLDYWWFFRFNESPVYEDFMCLAGMSILHRSCFDHQGDWEGITVSLDERGGTKGATVTYTGHDWPGYRYHWRALQRWGSIADRTHPVVYVARGSHASYPVACHDDCTQLDFRFKLIVFDRPVRDGPHNGKKDWPFNRDCRATCLRLLPTDFDENPVGWNGFLGEWGSASCTFVLKACTRSKGPLSPSRQPRYNEPFRGQWGDEEEVERQLRRKRG